MKMYLKEKKRQNLAEYLSFCHKSIWQVKVGERQLNLWWLIVQVSTTGVNPRITYFLNMKWAE